MVTGTLPRPPADLATVAPGTGRTRPALPRAALRVSLAAALAVVAVATLSPEGTGWAWGSPLVELRWYATGLDSGATLLQLVGNLVLLVVPAVLLVALHPALGRFRPLLATMLATGAGIELLQYALPVGRVVSPMDAALNALGATAAGVLVARLRRARAHDLR